jgi:hypothetical protein
MFIMATSISPSGNWIAETESTHVGIEITSTLKVAQANEDTKRIVEVVVGEAMLISEPYPLSWSPDEKYLYVTHRSGVDGCAPGVRSNDVHRGGDVYRFNLETNVLEEITEDGYWHVISPDGTKLAYLSTFRGLVLHDLVTSEEFEIRFELDNSYPYLLKSQLVWSPNNDAVLITASDDPCGLEPKYFLIHVDLDTFEQTTLIDDQKEAVFLILEWTTPEKALVELFDRKIAWVNTTTGELTPFEE